MDIASINKQALAQTYYILDNLDDNTRNKVPNSLLAIIKENMDIQYTNTTDLLIETKELLYAILNKYILSQSQKDKLAEYYRFYDAKMEEEKVMDCIECGSCSFTCPSDRPLLDYIRLGKARTGAMIRSRKK